MSQSRYPKKLLYPLKLFAFAVLVLGIIAMVLIYAVYPAPDHSRGDTRLLQWGHDTPRLQDIPTYSAMLSTLPFDGGVFDIATPEDRRGLAWTIFRYPLDDSLLDTVREQFSEFQWGQLTDNFLRVNIFNPELTWDDWTLYLDNLSEIANLAQDIGFKGIMLDTEQYGAVNIFDYPAQNEQEPLPYQDYADLAFMRGAETMQALQSLYPNITVILTYGITHRIASLNTPPLDQHRYGLIIPFIEGMVSTHTHPATLIDGFEGSYLYREESQFLLAYKWIKGGVSTKLTDGDRYRNVMQAGFGLWIDPYCGEGGLPEVGCGFTPEEFSHALEFALKYTDKYVWLYNEHINWYENTGIPLIWWDTVRNFARK